MKTTSIKSNVSVRIGPAELSDVPAIVKITNAAFAIETFLQGVRTDEERVRTMMQGGHFLVAEDGRGSVVASAYAELRGRNGYLSMSSTPRFSDKASGRYQKNQGESPPTRPVYTFAFDFCNAQNCSFSAN